MISNDYYFYVFLFISAFFMLVFFVFFVFFIYKELGGVRVGRDSFLFFDYMLFGSGWKANIPAVSMFLVLSFGVVQNYVKNYRPETLSINALGVFAAFFLFIHSRFLSGIHYNNDKKIKFLRELLWGMKMKPCFIVLWLSRLSYIAFFILAFHKIE